jgi:uncharacterized protein YabN with tetrapyrrole methylase and pyrophosphatase domain
VEKMDALHELINLEKDAVNFGFEWDTCHSILDWTISECEEVRQAVMEKSCPSHIQEEIGDLMQMTISLCLFMGFDVDETLTKTGQKFKTRMDALKKITQEEGLTSLHGQSTAYMLHLWKKAKESK